MQYVVCSDLESVFIPETWVCIARNTGIDELKLTTRDLPNYDELMKKRMEILGSNNLKLADLQKCIDSEKPFEGAVEFMDWIRSKTQLIVVSDIFKELVAPFIEKMKFPTLFCNKLDVDSEGTVSGYKLRQAGGKRMVVRAMKSINYKVIAFGDSYNDIDMIREADIGFLFNPSEKIRHEFPEIPVANNYEEARAIIEKYID